MKAADAPTPLATNKPFKLTGVDADGPVFISKVAQAE